QAHVPTADRIARVFSGNFKPPEDGEDSADDSEEPLEEIDFADLGTFIERSTKENVDPSMQVEMEVEERFTGTYQNRTQTIASHSEAVVTMEVEEPAASPTDAARAVANLSLSEPTHETIEREELSTIHPNITIHEDTSTSKDDTLGFFIDTEPSVPAEPHISPSLAPPVYSGPPVTTPPVIDGDDEVIVYVAPHPRSGRVTPIPSVDDVQPAVLNNFSVLTGRTIGPSMPPSIPEVGPAPTVDSISFSVLSASSNVSATDTGSGDQKPETELATTTESSNTAPPEPAAGPSRIRKPPVFSVHQHTPVKLKMRQRTQWAAKKRQGKARSTFASRGADVSEAQLRDWKVDPRKDERRQNDSDIEWGDEDDSEIEEEEEEVRAVVKDGVASLTVVSKSKGKGKAKADASTGAEGMDVDPELEMDVEAMKRFVEGMGGPDAGRFVTMDDLAVEQRIAEEDQEESEEGTEEDEDEENDDEDIEEFLEKEEELPVAEAGGLDLEDDEEDDEEEDDGSEDDYDQSPRSSFQARLDRIRQQSQNGNGKGKGKAAVYDEVSSDDDEDEDEWYRNRSWAEEDDDFIAHIQDVINENEDIMFGRDRAAKKQLFRAIQDGDFGDVDGYWEDVKPARKRKDKAKDLPPDLAALWEQDRKKKAIRKQERELRKLEAAADPLAKKKGGKKGQKAMLAAAKLDPTITVLPNRIIDMTTLVQQIRRFLDDLDGPQSMTLPPCNKSTRKLVHELANAFSLKSISKGRGDARYTTLTKTTMSGIRINEKKVGRIVRRGGGQYFGGEGDWEGGGRKGKAKMARHKEGDEVGKAAPKIDEGNVGFRMLASMGWSEGDRIGLSGGLRDPLTAVIKHTKLGLGATR
ncbi:squalene synthetase-like protein, partial [Stygiomarasmius scandens]